MRIGRSLLAGDRRYPAVESILRREPFDRDVQTTDLTRARALARRSPPRHPGPARLGKDVDDRPADPDLIAPGKTVGVASQSHKAIHNVLDEVDDAHSAARRRRAAATPSRSTRARTSRTSRTTTTVVDCDLTAGTAWLFSDPDHERTLDYLFIDEAGQVSLADALAMATCARNVVLVGDPQQLAQVIQGTHPPGALRRC